MKSTLFICVLLCLQMFILNGIESRNLNSYLYSEGDDLYSDEDDLTSPHFSTFPLEDSSNVDPNFRLDFLDEIEAGLGNVLATPLKRSRRRIRIFGGGGRYRNQGRNTGSGSTSGVTRYHGSLVSSFDLHNLDDMYRKPDTQRNKDPMGSPALYELYPELAPPGWRH